MQKTIYEKIILDAAAEGKLEDISMLALSLSHNKEKDKIQYLKIAAANALVKLEDANKYKEERNAIVNLIIFLDKQLEEEM